ncbi:protein unc-45 homolog B-like isoform X2 [Amphibalanus amphitrite]|nr:protein unc-45 homolog B-like isoform X2 [Amphibalanus amphitrite]XP_043202039.1 protein unc-45 homolog B-like isoform X2 [Amphibalanus amphitrite]
MVEMATPQQLKEDGNKKFKDGDFDGALASYTKALEISASDDKDRCVYLKNRAAVHLKKENYEAAVADCSEVLEQTPSDPKALFRRCQALEALGRVQEAYRDARHLHNEQPDSREVQPLLARLYAAVQKQMEDMAQVKNKVQNTYKYLFDVTMDKQKREDSANNMLVLAKERAGAEALMAEGVHLKIMQLLKSETNHEVELSCIRALGQLCLNSDTRSRQVLRDLGVPWLVELLNSNDGDRVNSAQYLLQVILSALAGMDVKGEKRANADLLRANKREVDSVMAVLTVTTNSSAMSARGRDAVIELLLKNCPYMALNWTENVLQSGGIQRLMEVASEMDGYRHESSMNITASTRTTVAVCLSKLYEDMYHDQAKQRFADAVEDFVKSKLVTPDIEGKVRVTSAITCLLLGPIDLGNKMLAKEGILEMMLVMANTDDLLQQRVACEALIAAASKKDKCKSILTQGVDILKRLYQSKNDSIRVRALVGLCKVGSLGGTDALVRPFADGSTMKLAEACRRFLVNPAKDKDLRKWATEGLSYLTLDAEVKEKLIEDRPALHAMLELAKSGDHSVVYGVVTTLVNLTNSYDTQEVIPEMIELAKFAKQHIPEEHELDDEDFVIKRHEVLCHEGVTSALVALSKTESQNSRELIARVFNALCKHQQLRGMVVQQGGARALIGLALEGTKKGKQQAAQALSRIAITIDPATAFPGQRACEVIRPILSLLHPECQALENFEALMALCNLAGMNDTVRKRIIKEKGVPSIESYMYEEHEMLRRAATQCICNLVCTEEYIKMMEGTNDRVKFLVLLVGEEDVDTSQAAAGALAMATSVSPTICKKVLDVASWHEMFRLMLANPREEITLRGVACTLNMLSADKEVAEKIVETDITEILMALTKLPPETDTRKKIIDYAEKCLAKAAEHKLIKPADQAGSDDEE